ncbi:hypothetical protein [Desulfovibrio sp. TomC]|uniref:hypothetical protein n=1 Tax=Desulfovibrio sp. TomC TaxID=1562888 RepID=UPI00057560E6|nr:hypothetical protein [Desulfovibrio sp. TomC]KHK04107.1 hypothetical protein NY78_0551 [Desulfovibrio sp. TomC]
MKSVVMLIPVVLLLFACQVEKHVEQDSLSKSNVVQKFSYKNKSIQGPLVVVLPGKISSNDLAFSMKVSNNNIADFAAIELSDANFQVVEASSHPAYLDEYLLALRQGDENAVRIFRERYFSQVKMILSFDVVKAEPVSGVNKSFNGVAIGSLVSMAMAFAGKADVGRATGAIISSVNSNENSSVWVVGMRYKVLSPHSGTQVSTNYLEDKLEVSSQSQSFLCITKGEAKRDGFDSIVERLIQKSVEELDTSFKTSQIDEADIKLKRKESVKGDEKVVDEYVGKVKKKKQETADALVFVERYKNGQVSLSDPLVVYCASTRALLEEAMKNPQMPRLDELEKQSAKLTGDLRETHSYKYQIVESGVETCKIRCTDRYTITVMGSLSQGYYSVTYSLAKENGEWKICDIVFG